MLSLFLTTEQSFTHDSDFKIVESAMIKKILVDDNYSVLHPKEKTFVVQLRPLKIKLIVLGRLSICARP